VLPLKELFKAPTIAGISEYLSEAELSAYTSIEVTAEKKDCYKASSAQKRIFVLQQLAPDVASYNIPIAVTIDGDLDKKKLETAFDNLIKRHEALRTTFETIEDQIIQRIHNNVFCVLEYEEKMDEYAKKNEELIEEEIKDFIKPFELSKAPLLRASLKKLAKEKHLFLFDIHHILADGTSISILIKEFLELYQGNELAEQRIQYKDFSKWQNTYLKSESMQKKEKYWIERFSDEIPVLNMPLDYTRPVVQEFVGDSIAFTLGEKLSGKLRTISRETGATLYMVLLSAINILLYKYSGQEDIIIGSPIACRSHTDIGNMMGVFINMLVMRNYPVNSKTYEEFLMEVRENALKAYENQDYQFEEMVSKLKLRRDVSRSPLFDVMFALQNMEISDGELEGLSFRSHDPKEKIARFDLSFIAAEIGKDIEVRIEYCTSLFKGETIERIASHLCNLLDVITKDRCVLLCEIGILSGEEQNKLLYEFNNTYVDYPRNKTIYQLFEEQAEQRPDNVALVFEEKEMTYKELNAKSNQIARLLRNKGVKPGSIIGIMVERSFELIIGVLSILKAGGAYLPIDTEYPAERINYMLEDSKSSLLLTDSDLNNDVAFNREVINLKHLDLDSYDYANLACLNTVNDSVYVIYTSGSTGRPKGTMIHHMGLVNYIWWSADTYFKGKNDSIALFTSISFDLTMEPLFIPLISGNKIIIYKNDETDFLLYKILRENKATVIKLTPAHLAMLKGMDNRDSNVKILIVGGDDLKVSLVKEISDSFGDIEIYNSYGPTEASIGCTIYKYEEKKDERLSVPIGVPIYNTQIYILDKNLNVVPIGVAGELFISGDGLAHGYLNLPELTVDKFRENPFLIGKRMYRTGDLARWLPDGNIEFLGRVGHQVKIRGFRIELGEIESRLLEIETVKEAVVIAKEDESGDKYLCAYVVAKKELSAKDLRERLTENLPDYMIPSYFVQLTELPLNPSGKVDRKALPLPEGGLSGMEHVKPRTEEEKVVAGIFSEILGIEKVGAMDDFFMLGGDSIKAIRIISKLREAGYELNVRDLLKSSTVEQSSRIIRKRAEEMLNEQDEVEGEALLIPIQKWFFESNLLRANHFNLSIMLKIVGRVEIKMITSVLDAIVKHHDILRAVYKYGRQEILSYKDSVGYEMREYDYRGSELKGTELARCIEAKNNELQGSINIETGPLMKAGLFKTEEADHLMVCIHHLAVDGISWRIIMEDLEIGFKQYLAGSEIKFSEKTASYKAWGSALKEYSKSDLLKRDIKYWKQVAETIKEGMIEKSDTGEEGWGYISVNLEKEETDKLLYQSGKAFGTEINDLLLSGLGLAVFNLTGQKKLSVNLEGHGREAIHKKIDIDRTVGWFTSIYPVIIEVSNDVREMIISTKEMLRKVPNKGLGYAVLKYLLEEAFCQEEAQVTFNYLGSIDAEIDTHSLIFGASPYSRGIEVAKENLRKDIIALNCIIVGSKLNIDIAYRKDKLTDEDANCLGELYKESLIEVVNTCVRQEGQVKTPSDFGLTDNKMSQNNLEGIIKEHQADKIYSLTPMQEGMFYHKLLRNDSTEYVIQSAFRYQGILDIEAIRQSLFLLSMKHEVLRTAFIITKNNSWQIILHDRYIELNDLCAEDEVEIESLKRSDIKRGFDLKDDSLLRVSIIRKGNEESVILWTMHHIIADGWCVSLLFGDFINMYNQLLHGDDYKALMLEAEREKGIRGSYQDYIHILEQKDREAGLQYWGCLLGGYNGTATIVPMQAEETENEVERLNLKIDRGLSKKLQAFAQKEKITMNNITEVAWGIVLQKYNNTNDVVFGKVVSGRDVAIKGIESIVGLFINTVPIRVNNDQNATIRDLLQSVHRQGIESSEYDYCSLAEIQGTSELGRYLFSTIFVYENYYIDNHIFDETGSQQLEGSIIVQGTREQTNYGISVSAHYSDGLNFSVLYDPRVYGETDIEFILKRIEMVVKEIATNPDKLIADIDIVSESEKNKLLYEFNDTYAEYPQEKTIQQLFEEQVKRTPYNVAVVFDEDSMTYSELNARANQVARVLREKGVKPDSIVGIMFERSFEMIIGILGILKAGGAYLPIDPEYPEERIKFMLKDCEAKILLTQSWLSDMLEFDGDIFGLDNDTIYKGSDFNLETVNQTSDLVYVIYTSGSTGMPKGVMIEHRSLVNYCSYQINRLKINEHDRSLQTSTITFDMSVEQIFTAVLAGAALYMIEKDVLLDHAKFVSFMKDNAITYLHAVPSLLDNLNTDGLDHLKRIVSGGELCTSCLIKKLIQGKKFEFHNSYGPTEATIISNMHLVRVDALKLNAVIPIGRPISNCKLYILDPDQNLVPIGVQGELYISGDGLARGYLKRPELTAEKFGENPFIPGERMYRTGDLARWLPDGNIEFLGRIDHQVKIRGLRIELGEIESRLTELKTVREALVLVREDESGDKYLCAYVVSEEEISVKELRESLGKTLPDYMIPSYFMQLDAIPLNQSGKVDRKMLPTIEAKKGCEYIAPRTEEERVVVKVFDEILGMDNIGVEDDFFALGGDSIKAIRIVSKLREAGYDLSIRNLMQNSTVELTSKAVKKREEEITYEQGEIVGKAPLTPVQEWFFESNLANPNHFNQSIMLKCKERIEIEGIAAVIDAIVKHHDILRVMYRDGVQEIMGSHEIAGYELHEYDYRETNLIETELAKRLEEKNNELQASINLERGPIMKVGLFRAVEADHLMICIHHLTVDGVSWRIFMEDLDIGYNQYLAGSEIKFSEKTASYKDWGEALKEYSKSDELKKELSYWKHVSGMVAEGKIDKTLTVEKEIGLVNVTLNEEETDKLLYQSGKAFGTEINDLLLSGLGLAVRKLTGQEKVSVNLEGHGREAIHKRIDIDRTIGWFSTIFPVIIGVNNDVKEMIIETKEMLRKVPNKGLGYGVLRYLSGVEFRQEEAQVTFNYLGSIEGETGIRAGRFEASEYSSGRGVALENIQKDILNINCIVIGGKLDIDIGYRKDKFGEEDAKRFGKLFIEALEEIVSICSRYEETVKTPSDFGLSGDNISPAELEEWLKDF
jgi:amino acid adenylation domain-containing protein/non-ribosomal peptide synthase protein (TIGR01720 family)